MLTITINGLTIFGKDRVEEDLVISKENIFVFKNKETKVLENHKCSRSFP